MYAAMGQRSMKHHVKYLYILDCVFDTISYCYCAKIFLSVLEVCVRLDWMLTIQQLVTVSNLNPKLSFIQIRSELTF